MNAIQLIEQQHDDVEDLFRRCERAEGEEKRILFYEICDTLAIHTAIEEEHFYPSVRMAQTEALLDEAERDHQRVKALMADLMQLDLDDAGFDDRLAELEQLVMHHVKDEEEAKLIPIVERELDDDQLLALGQKMIATMTKLLEEEPEPRTVVFEELERQPPA